MTSALSPRALEDGRTFVTALLVGVRKARALPANPESLELAVETIHRAAQGLYASTGGFSLQFLPDAIALNGFELPYENLAATAAVRQALEARGVTSLGMKSEPNLAAVRRLVQLFAPGAPGGQARGPRGESSGGAGPAAVTAPAVRRRDAEPRPEGDRRLHAVTTYGRLLLAVREQRARAETESAAGASERSRPRVHAARVLDDLVELARDAAPELLRLAALPVDRPSPESHGANTAVLSVLLGYALGVGRRELLDLGVAALFHALAVPTGATAMRPEALHAAALRLARDVEPSPSSALRGVIVAEQIASRAAGAPRAHPLARVLAVASAYDRWVNGYAVPNGNRLHPLDALLRLQSDATGRYDPRLVDLLVMVLRAFPAGTVAVLESGEAVKVVDYGPRWDRPRVESLAHAGRAVDLMSEAQGQLVEGIAGTALFHGLRPERRPSVHPGAGSAPSGSGDDRSLDGAPRAPSAARPSERRPLKARETISAQEAVARVRLPWVEQRAKQRVAADAGESGDVGPPPLPRRSSGPGGEG